MRQLVRDAITRALDALRTAGWAIPLDVTVSLDRPRRPEHGDAATGLALALAKTVGRKPVEIAHAMAAELRAEIARGDGPLSAVEVAPPGFLNLRVRDAAFHSVIQRVLSQGARYGTRTAVTETSHGHGHGHGVLVEFVSANPTGPLHVGHGRGAVVGDVLVRLLRAAGESVTTEYYVNDAGAQVRLLAASVRAMAGGQTPRRVATAGTTCGTWPRRLPVTHRSCCPRRMTLRWRMRASNG